MQVVGRAIFGEYPLGRTRYYSELRPTPWPDPSAVTHAEDAVFCTIPTECGPGQAIADGRDAFRQLFAC